MLINIANLSLNVGQPNIHNWVDYSTICIGICSLIIALCSMIFSYISIKQQKEQFEKQLLDQHNQWKYDAIVRSEMDVLISLRSSIYYAKDAIHWFMWDFLSPFGDYPKEFHNTELEIFRRNIFVKFWNELNDINNEFNKNLFIWQKCRLASKIQFIQTILSLITFLPQNGDFEIEFKEGTKNYRIKDSDKIKYAFANKANEMLSKSNIVAGYKKIEESELLNNYNFIWGKVLDILINLETDINKIMVDYEKIDIPESENVGIRTFMPYTKVK